MKSLIRMLSFLTVLGPYFGRYPAEDRVRAAMGGKCLANSCTA